MITPSNQPFYGDRVAEYRKLRSQGGGLVQYHLTNIVTLMELQAYLIYEKTMK